MSESDPKHFSFLSLGPKMRSFSYHQGVLFLTLIDRGFCPTTEIIFCNCQYMESISQNPVRVVVGRRDGQRENRDKGVLQRRFNTNTSRTF